ncbi:MAG: putative sulfonate transporter [Thermoleophilia bacterium]|nr:putative sulfonate transporter [Thermoleophilia bacterium]
MEHELLLAAFAAWCFLVALVGGLLGLVLGNLRLPVLLLLSPSAAAGAGANLAVSGVTAATAAVTHLRAGRFHRRIFLVMAAPSIVGAIIGSLFASQLSSDTLLALIGVTLVGFGIDTLRGRRAAPRARTDAGRFRNVAVAGLVIGLLGGIVGLILGALRMPALLRWFPEVPKQLVGTNLAVGVLVGAAGALAHVPTAFDMTTFLVGSAASIPGALLGARLTGRLPDRHLVRGIGIALVIGGVATLVRILL